MAPTPPMQRVAAVTLTLAVAWLAGSVQAAQCPPLKYKTVDAQCRYVMGKPLPCDEPVPPGTTANFDCKPLYRLPLSLTNRVVHPEAGVSAVESSVCREDGKWAPLPFSCVPECGRIVGKGEPLIVDGTPVSSPLEYPWHVAVYDRRDHRGVFQICGGTLITTKFFVSAAHCFATSSHAKDVPMRSASDFAVAVGKLNRDWDAVEAGVQKRDVANIHTRGYGGPRLNYVRDLALVEMDVAVELTASTLPACVDWGLQETHLQDGHMGSVVGWGGLNNAPSSQHLQWASLPFVPKEKCLRSIPAHMVQYVLLNDDRFCAGLLNGTTVAHGDSGGGLAFPNSERKWFLHGVVSVGMPERRTYTAFTNVTSFVRWMADKIQDEEIRAAAAEHKTPVEIPMEYTASDLEEEQRVAYFREDLGLNLHHTNWHQYHPYIGPFKTVNKDRRGELFFYMHAQLIARYNAERLSNRLSRVKRIVLREPIKEGYFPKLDNLVSSRVWPGRAPNTLMRDLNRDGMKIDIEDLERWSARINEAIAVGAVVNTTGGLIKLTEEKGADMLGNMIESSILTPNLQLYGELLIQGHILISMAHDPENRFLESFGVMGDRSTACRDPAFYRWHMYVQDMMRDFKRTLPSYSPQQLSFPGVSVVAVDVQSERSSKPNELLTHWQASDLELSRGLDFSPRPPVFARVTHLQHEPFIYTIQVENKGPKQKEGYVRIFLAPKLNERGKQMHLDDLRHFMIEMDKFPVILQPGLNVMQRKSSDSSVTIPFERTFRNLDSNRPVIGRAAEEFTFCGCGWPQHLLVPRGAPEGLPHYLFVMVTDFEKDVVDQVVQGSCNEAHSLCGFFYGKYPDKKAMGFPFDRRPMPRVDSLRSFLTQNMFSQNVVVRFRDTVVQAARNSTVFGNDKNVLKLPPTLGLSIDRLQQRQKVQQQQQPVIVRA